MRTPEGKSAKSQVRTATEGNLETLFVRLSPYEIGTCLELQLGSGKDGPPELPHTAAWKKVQQHDPIKAGVPHHSQHTNCGFPI